MKLKRVVCGVRRLASGCANLAMFTRRRLRVTGYEKRNVFVFTASIIPCPERAMFVGHNSLPQETSHELSTARDQRMLLVSFRRECEKQQSQQKSGAGEMSPSKEWFAFKFLTFLVENSVSRDRRNTIEVYDVDDDNDGNVSCRDSGESSTSVLTRDDEHTDTTGKTSSADKQFQPPPNTSTATTRHWIEDEMVNKAYKFMKSVQESVTKEGDFSVYDRWIHFAGDYHSVSTNLKPILHDTCSRTWFVYKLLYTLNSNQWKTSESQGKWLHLESSFNLTADNQDGGILSCFFINLFRVVATGSALRSETAMSCARQQPAEGSYLEQTATGHAGQVTTPPGLSLGHRLAHAARGIDCHKDRGGGTKHRERAQGQDGTPDAWPRATRSRLRSWQAGRSASLEGRRRGGDAGAPLEQTARAATTAYSVGATADIPRAQLCLPNTQPRKRWLASVGWVAQFCPTPPGPHSATLVIYQLQPHFISPCIKLTKSIFDKIPSLQTNTGFAFTPEAKAEAFANVLENTFQSNQDPCDRNFTTQIYREIKIKQRKPTEDEPECTQSPEIKSAIRHMHPRNLQGQMAYKQLF
ncbi:hypothetical protein PR048_027676 [Dryococelus australis]|uniref:Uncharacterized protein n=1 Tax=Dryococelus australis TaxID=614101 RepID=A0ABQ9GH68_9NEOP|nr:hypothetical protein PR048_027676 [Dryococelus australis]